MPLRQSYADYKIDPLADTRDELQVQYSKFLALCKENNEGEGSEAGKLPVSPYASTVRDVLITKIEPSPNADVLRADQRVMHGKLVALSSEEHNFGYDQSAQDICAQVWFYVDFYTKVCFKGRLDDCKSHSPSSS